MTEELNLFSAFILYKRSIVRPGEKQRFLQTVRLIKATDKKNAGEKLQDFWKDKMKSFTVVQFEINAVIE